MGQWSKLASLVFTAMAASIALTRANPDAKRLYDDLLSDYNKLIRPVGNNSDKLRVKLGLKLSQLIDVNLKNQIMTTNVWVEQEWTDYKLTWNPDEYGGVETLHVPAEHIWRPDIVLYNNADGNYEITIMTKALLNYTGKVRWKPPAIYKSSCQMDVEYFPFDVQTCNMKFGCWTYDRQLVDLSHINQTADSEVVEVGVDLREYYISVEWDIMKVPAQRLEEEDPCCLDNFQFIYFNITLRRKTLFYTVNLIIPCVGISFMSAFVFYLPSDSGEKISFSISILLSLTVFFLLLAEIIPPTSLAVPLLGKYLLFAMTLITFSVVVTICILNLHYRSPATHKMPRWVKSVFMHTLPKYLFIQRPKGSSSGVEVEEEEEEEDQVNEMEMHFRARSSRDPEEIVEIHSLLPSPPSPPAGSFARLAAAAAQRFPEAELPLNMEKCAYDARFIANRMKNRDRFEAIEEDWKYIAMVLDRLFLWIFLLSCTFGTISIIFRAPSLYDTTVPLDRQLSKIVNLRRMQMGPEDTD